MLIKAVKANQHEFSILQYDGDKYIVQRNEILAIMGELANLFARELPKSRSQGETQCPRLHADAELAVPREASGLGHRQLNELLAKTPYHRRYIEHYLDRRIGRSITASAPAAERRPPASKGAPSAAWSQL